ncbi:MAG: hypothetical protein ACOC1K_08275 [Nanoarchaeota archaeon]
MTNFKYGGLEEIAYETELQMVENNSSSNKQPKRPGFLRSMALSGLAALGLGVGSLNAADTSSIYEKYYWGATPRSDSGNYYNLAHTKPMITNLLERNDEQAVLDAGVLVSETASGSGNAVRAWLERQKGTSPELEYLRGVNELRLRNNNEARTHLVRALYGVTYGDMNRATPLLTNKFDSPLIETFRNNETLNYLSDDQIRILAKLAEDFTRPLNREKIKIENPELFLRIFNALGNSYRGSNGYATAEAFILENDLVQVQVEVAKK